MVADCDVTRAELCALSVIAAISCSLTQEHMAAARRDIVKTVCTSASKAFYVTAVFHSPCKRGKEFHTCFPLTFTIFSRASLRTETDDYDFINILRAYLICHLEPLQQGHKLLLEVRLL